MTNASTDSRAEEEFDYIVVGSGAGGGPLAARLAEAGFRVLVIEAGSNHTEDSTTREVSEVPALHAVSTENPELSWEFFVKHYDAYPGGRVDSKWHTPQEGEGPDKEGIFYPRVSAVGGCTIHNALITIMGPDSDWDSIADFVKDQSWAAAVMRPFFTRLERNQYLPAPPQPPTKWWDRAWDDFLWLLGFNPDYTGGEHGFAGWLRTTVSSAEEGLGDKQLLWMLGAALEKCVEAGLLSIKGQIKKFIREEGVASLDPNHAWRQATHPEGPVQIPIAVYGRDEGSGHRPPKGYRSSPRERLEEVQKAHPDKLTIWTDCFVTKVILTGGEDTGEPLTARGVEYLKGKHLYGAHPMAVPATEPGVDGSVMARREVILCGGSFNTPQLLMLSGIGDREHLDQMELQCRHHLPGVGRNLQDRYEVTIVSKMNNDFTLLNGISFKSPEENSDRALSDWQTTGDGLYASNGSVLGIFKRSSPHLSQPDLFIFGLPLSFKGYAVGYSRDPAHNYFTWAILKAHTGNKDGTVRLRTNKPLDTPEINFHYFHEASWTPEMQADDPDLRAIVEGVKFVSGITKHASLIIKQRENPPVADVPDLDNPDDTALRNWIRRETWGHHACGTCRMGPKGDGGAVLDSNCRVYGVKDLRVVDASIFPRIPGYFIVTNIYIASEKVAADIIAEAVVAETIEKSPLEILDSPEYPREMRAAEIAAIDERRKKCQPARDATGVSKAPPIDPETGYWSTDVTGFGISGGGVRSATINLGILQGLAGAGVLRKIDFMSTVSGGGYVGSFLGRFFDRMRYSPFPNIGTQAQTPMDTVEHELLSPFSPVMDWLRKHANYIAPGGGADVSANVAIFVRNLASIHFVLGAFLLTLFGLANALRYIVFDPATAVAGLAVRSGAPSILPLGWLLGNAIGVFWSPWFVLFELCLLFLVLPRMLGFWIASQDEPNAYDWPAVAILFTLLVPLLYLSVRDGLATQPLFLALSVASSFVAVEFAWRRDRAHKAAVGTGSKSIERLRTRTELTKDLGLALAVSAALLGFAVVDAIGHGLQQWLVAHNRAYTLAFTGFGAAIIAIMPALRSYASMLSSPDKPGPPSTVTRILKHELTSLTLTVVLIGVPLIFYAFISHASSNGGEWIPAGVALTVLFGVISIILANPKALPFVNRSSLQSTYSNCIARTYLGASNPLRHHPAGGNVDEVMAGDDVDSLRDYKPHEAGGPLHIINMTINQTVDFNSQRGDRSRMGENMAVTCMGLSVGTEAHAFWEDAKPTPRESARGIAPSGLAGICPVGWVPGTEHPLIDETGRTAARAEMLPLRQWIGISGAAIGPSRGQNTGLSTALIFALTNLRTGYWWDSSIIECQRDGFPELSPIRRFLYLLPRIFLTQSLLIFECIARFPGPWERYWNLSDSGFFEALGAYELIRRRVPRIIISDGGEDPSYQFSDFGNMVEKVRIDFGAQVELIAPASYAQLGIPTDIQALLGTLDDLRPRDCIPGAELPTSLKRAALYRVRYEDGTCPYNSFLLYIKSCCTGNEPADVTSYRVEHPEFPHESTDDQFFNEPQWESYRALGQTAAGELFSTDWFWTIKP